MGTFNQRERQVRRSPARVAFIQLNCLNELDFPPKKLTQRVKQKLEATRPINQLISNVRTVKGPIQANPLRRVSVTMSCVAKR